ncbi:hypothetical protein [Janthinobacterium agaricidamnosum]|uniref:Flagellar hook-length control protein n=1 Tax=Janthinobacterium agaricidamnosum NBRC 102515 = DSM 9628 TaxID=1349767 RepID=W0V4H9_9BURK|nr:hypothetical protein [Janthinobacterium agaricidamnosum]CDG82263.1 flagellar hook-length control protein [Janthinobacterium agaricidamnosum NBRC 102515 = DSM 9628]
MSIAVSAVVRPSVCLRLLQACFAVGGLAAGAVLAAGGDAHAWRWPGAAASIAGGGFLLFFLRQHIKPQRLDISGVGSMRLAVYLEAGGDDGRTVELQAGSTLWPGLLLLRLRGEAGRIGVLPVWPGQACCTDFRGLAVACRAIAGRGADIEQKN